MVLLPLFLPWGEAGAYGQARQGSPCFTPAPVLGRVVDSLGAGDVFNAAVIDGLLGGYPWRISWAAPRAWRDISAASAGWMASW